MATANPSSLPRRVLHDPLDRREFMKLTSALAAGWTIRAGGATAAGAAPATTPFNVVLIVSDQHRREGCGCFGSRIRRRDGSSPTPHIDALAARGVAFDAAYCAAPLCAPSRAAYFTGVYPHTTTSLYHKMLGREAGLARFPGVRGDLRGMGEYFREAGYRTASVGKVHVHGETRSGWDLGFDLRAYRFYTQFPGAHYSDLKGGDTNRRYRQLAPYAGKTYQEIDPVKFRGAPKGLLVQQNTLNPYYLETLVETEAEMFDHVVADCSLSFIDECHARHQPFFIHIGFEKPHEPWTVHQKYLDFFDPAAIPLPETLREWQERGMTPSRGVGLHRDMKADEVRRISAAYFACAASMDEQVGRMVARCKELGVLDRTVFVYTSDHGEMLFEHGLIYKHNMFESAVGVPFVLAGPGLPQGTRTQAPASLIDLIPTFQELTGLPVTAGLEGRSLVAAAKGRGDMERIVFSEFYQSGSGAWGGRYLPVRMAKQGALKYIYAHGCVDEFYDLATDPKEVRNLALEPAWAGKLARLRFACLREWELDEHPQLWVRARYASGAVELSWQDAGQGATYELWRETAGGEPERIANGIARPMHRDETATAGASHRYWVVARPAFTRRFKDRAGHSRYGETPVLTASYPGFLPITPALTIASVAGASAEARYRPWHGLSFAGAEWIFEGMPPTVEGRTLRGAGPLVIQSPTETAGDVAMTFDLKLAPAEKPKAEGIALVFARTSVDQFCGVEISPAGRVSLFEQNRQWEELAVAKSRVDFSGKAVRLALRVTGRTVSVTADGASLIEWSGDEPIGPGRYGIAAPVNSVPFTLGVVAPEA